MKMTARKKKRLDRSQRELRRVSRARRAAGGNRRRRDQGNHRRPDQGGDGQEGPEQDRHGRAHEDQPATVGSAARSGEYLGDAGDAATGGERGWEEFEG